MLAVVAVVIRLVLVALYLAAAVVVVVVVAARYCLHLWPRLGLVDSGGLAMVGAGGFG
jgi:hypothetical protein